jgi:hypothetical protein
MAPKLKSNDADSVSKPKRSRDVFFISKKVKIQNIIEIKKSYLEIAGLYRKKEFSIREVMKGKEKIRVSFSVARQTANVNAIVRVKC